MEKMPSNQHNNHESDAHGKPDQQGQMADSSQPMDMEHHHHEGHTQPSRRVNQAQTVSTSNQEVGGAMESDRAHQAHEAHADHTGHELIFRNRFWICLLLSIPVLVYSPLIQELLHFTPPVFPFSDWIAPIFAIIIFVYGGLPFLRLAIPELKNRQPGMMTLISLAIAVAFVYSLAALFLPGSMAFFWELVTLIDIMLLGHWIEMRSVRQASGALQELARLMPDEAERIREDGGTEIVRVEQLKIDDLILVRPGSSIPADGKVVEGKSDVNEAMLTGESRPVKKAPRSDVIAGTINGDGSLHIQVAAVGDKTALAGIMRLVEQAQQSKSNTQILADKAAGWLFYIALGVAVITGIAWTIAVDFNAEVIARVATVLVIACPHALGLAIPLVVAISTSMAARQGILVRDRLAFEQSRSINMVVFDKTGTLTEGQFGVAGMEVARPWNEADALALAAAVEGDSEHTIARGLRKSAQDRKLTIPAISNFEAIKGRGVRAHHDGKDIYVGGPRLLEMLAVSLPENLEQFSRQADQKGQTVVHLVEAGQTVASVAASFALADIVRPESRTAISTLHAMGVQVAMLTGDSEAVAKAVTDELGITTYFAEVLPENKDRKVADLQQAGWRVAMVGDGVNDAPALARADVGIAIGSGTDVAIESAGIILVKSNPLDVVNLIDLGRASYRKMIQNLAWAMGYNVIALPLAAGVLAPFGIVLSPAVGALLMSISTVIVAINAQLLRRHRLGSARS